MTAEPAAPSAPIRFGRTLHLLDARAPHRVHAQLERATAVVFAAPAGAAVPSRQARLAEGGTTYRLELGFVAALPDTNLYRLVVEVCGRGAADDAASLRRRADAWLDVWTHGLVAIEQLPGDPGSAERHAALTAQWNEADAKLADPAATQRAILDAMRAGARFSIAHKEGGTTLRFDGRGFVRADFGDFPSSERFAGDAQFLAFLRRFFDAEISRHVWPEQLREADAWRLIYRRMDDASPGDALVDSTAAAGAARRRNARRASAAAVALALAGGAAWLKIHPRADAPRAEAGAVPIRPPAGPDPAVLQRVEDAARRAAEAARAAAASR